MSLSGEKPSASPSPISRRNFLRGVSVAGAVAVPVLSAGICCGVAGILHEEGLSNECLEKLEKLDSELNAIAQNPDGLSKTRRLAALKDVDARRVQLEDDYFPAFDSEGSTVKQKGDAFRVKLKFIFDCVENGEGFTVAPSKD